MDEEAERLVVQMAKGKPSWGYDRIVGALAYGIIAEGK
jgi:DNA-binding transcriptional regulator GbsR (MarR family)